MAGPLIAAAAQPGRRGTVKTRAAALSIASNAILIALKLAAGAITGSVAILTEAMHSSIDLIASFVAYFSVREADKPADAEHPYGHAKIENLAAAIEAMLILVGSGVIIYAAARSLANGPEVHSLGIGIAVIAISIVANLVVSTKIARRARDTESPALEGDAAHLRTDAATSAAVLVGLVVVQITGAAWLDPVIALAVAAAIVYAGVRLLARASRVLVDEALPPEELDAVRDVDRRLRPGGRLRLSQAARAPGGLAPLRRHARAVRLRHDPRGRPPDRPRAAGRDQGAPARRRRAHPPRARGQRASGHGDPAALIGVPATTHQCSAVLCTSCGRLRRRRRTAL